MPLQSSSRPLPHTSVAPRWMLSLMGLFVPVLRDALASHSSHAAADDKLKAVRRLFDRVPDMRLKHASVF